MLPSTFESAHPRTDELLVDFTSLIDLVFFIRNTKSTKYRSKKVQNLTNWYVFVDFWSKTADNW